MVPWRDHLLNCFWIWCSPRNSAVFMRYLCNIFRKLPGGLFLTLSLRNVVIKFNPNSLAWVRTLDLQFDIQTSNHCATTGSSCQRLAYLANHNNVANQIFFGGVLSFDWLQCISRTSDDTVCIWTRHGTSASLGWLLLLGLEPSTFSLKDELSATALCQHVSLRVTCHHGPSAVVSKSLLQ